MKFDFINIEYVVVAIGIAVLYLLYYMFIKEAQYTKNIRSMATVIEELNREIFYLKKRLDETSKNAKTTPPRMSDEEVYQEIERSAFDMVKPLSVAIKNLQQNLNTLDENLNARISVLENGVKQISIPSSIHANDDEKIISLYKQGVSLDTIAKELHISKAEVEFVLKINRIK